MAETPEKKLSALKKWILMLILIIVITGAWFGFSIYEKLFAPNVSVSDNTFVNIPTGSDLQQIVHLLSQQRIIDDSVTFLWTADKKHLAENIHPGHYLIKNKMNNNDLVDLLRSGRQTPVKVTFNNVRTKADLAGKIAQYIEPDSMQILNYFDSASYFKSDGLNKDDFMTLFIPNTYEVYWNTTIDAFVKRMRKEHDVFWNSDRLAKAKQLNLSQEQIYILASIVYSETKRLDEAPRIAGLYINRLQKNMLLQSDPTVVYAIGDFSITRVLNADLEIDSPYNTYKYYGLPPGPIQMPPIAFIDAVLNYEHHDYLYMCAKGDGSGYHYFAKTMAEHEANARRYQEELNKSGIYK